MGIILFNPDDLEKYKGEKAVMLYSGGLDSLYAALRLVSSGIEVYAINVEVGQHNATDICKTARQISIHFHRVDVRETLCQRFLSKGIMANALYNRYPISSSYTRPLIAEEAVKYALQLGSRLIVHSATPLQNSASRFNASILALSSEVDIYCPAIVQHLTRQEKAAALERCGLHYEQGPDLISVDENLWARVMESGPLEHPWVDVPQDIFHWTSGPSPEGNDPLTVSIGFEKGLPTHLNGSRMGLESIISTLNAAAGPYGVGRFTGFENNSFGVKNREIREAPAAHLLHQSHLLLEEMVLSAQELRMKRILDAEWTGLVVSGGWFSKLKKHLDEAIESFNEDLTGELKWGISTSECLCISSRSQNEYAFQHQSFFEEFAPYSLNSFYQKMARDYRII